MNNQLYPCGRNFDAFLEYRLACPRCGRGMQIFLPANTDTHSYTIPGNLCHPFTKSLSREGRDNVLRLFDDAMGGFSLCDSYHLYPMVEGETAEERQARLVRLKETELSHRLPDAPEKRGQIIEETAKRNETVLNALESILSEYEKTPREGWGRLDSILQSLTPRDDAKALLRRFGLMAGGTPAVKQNPSMAVSIESFGTFAVRMPNAAKPTWTCSCGSVNNSKFCPNCGTPRG